MKLALKRFILLWIALLLVVPVPVSVYGAENPAGANIPDGYVRIKNKWLGTYLYEDTNQVVRYGFTSITDPSSEWTVESAPGNASHKRIKNRATGRYITMEQVGGRREAVTTTDAAASTLNDQWLVEAASREGAVTIRTATTPSVNNFIHIEDQLGFAEVSSDIGATWESPQWTLEPVHEELPVRIVNKFRAGQYLYEDSKGIVEFGKQPLNDETSHWYVEVQQDNGNGTKTVRLKNRATGHYITQGVDYEPIKNLPFVDSKVNQWIMADGTEQGWVTFTNVDALAKNLNYVLNTQFEDTSLRSNVWPERPPVPPQQNVNAQWKLETAADVAPVRIASFTEHQVSDAYLYEEDGTVKYGALPDSTVTSSVYYQWLVEDYNGNKRIKNYATGSYISMDNSAQAAAPLQSRALAGGPAANEWKVSPSTIYDDYVTVQSAVYGSAYVHMTDELGFAQASAVNPDTNPAQWLFEDLNANAGAAQYVQIQNEWQALSLYEDENGDLKYGNVKSDDYKGQWLIERFAGRKRIQNRATGHYINMQDMSSGHIRVTDVEDSWKSAIWVVETLSGGAKLIHSVNDNNSDINHQKFIHLQNLLKYAEYGEITRSWGSPHWKFIPVTGDSTKYYLIKNNATGKYFSEEVKPGVENGKVQYGDIDPQDTKAHWYIEDAGGGQQYIRNRNTGHYIAMQNVNPDDNAQKTPLDSMNVDLSWGIASPKWYIENAPTAGFKVIRSGWTGEHYINVKDQMGYAQANKQVSDLGSAQFKFEDAPAVQAQLPQGFIRIKNVYTNQYLFENNRGIVMYGTPEANNGFSHWSVESSNGIQRIKNRATGHYIVLNTDYSYLQSADAGSDNASSRWVIESDNGGATYLIRSAQSHFNDEYINVQNGLGYPERGLYPSFFGTLQWSFEQATANFVTPSVNEVRNDKTQTPVFEDTNYSKFYNKATGQYLYEDGGQAAVSEQERSDLSDQWMIQDFNGRKLLKNRATGHLMAASSNLSTVLSGSVDSTNLTSQWQLQEELGYVKIVNAAQQHYVYTAQNAVRQGALSEVVAQTADWMIKPVAGDAVYEAEEAFIAGGVQKSSVAAGFTGTGYADHFAEQGAKIIFGVNALDEQEYDATVRFSNAEASAQTITVYVNGLNAKQLTFAASEQAGAWSELPIKLKLRAGYNSVVFETGAMDSGKVAIDSLTVHNAVNKAYRGAIQPYITYEAEHSDYAGTLIGPSRTYREVANEASGRKAVKLDQADQYVKFKTAKAANSIVLRYAIPDSASGSGIQTTIGLYVNGVKVKDLELTSKYAWEYGNYPWSNDPQQGSAHRFFDEVHALIGDVPAGAEVMLKNDANTADYYIIDFAELEQVSAQPYDRPEGFLSVTDFGAVANDGQDDSDAFQATMDAAMAQHKGVWFPAGAFELANNGELFMLDDVTIRGAGMWHTTLKGAKFYGTGSNIRVYDLLLDGELNIRDDEAHTNGFEGAFGPGSTIQSVWIEHTKTAMWIARAKPQFGFNSDLYTNEFYVAGLRMRNLMADGINFSINTKNSMVEQSNVRYPGDDGLAMWSTLTTGYPNDFTENNTFRFDTVQLPWLSNNMVLFGGKDNKMQDNVLSDTIGLGGGIVVSTRFEPTPFSGTTSVERNTMIRTGSRDAGLNLNFGAIWLYADTKPIDSPIVVKDNVALDSTYQGISIQGSKSINQVSLQNIVIDGTGIAGVEVAGSVSGEASVDNVIIRNARLGDVVNNAGSNFKLKEINDGFASSKGQPADPTKPSSGGSGGPAPTAAGQVKVNDKQLSDAVASGQKRIAIETDGSQSSAAVEVSAAALLKAAKDAPGTVLVIKHGAASYEVPADIQQLLGSTDISGIDLSAAVVKVVIGKPDDASAEKLRSSAASSGLQIAGEPVSFELWLQAGDKSVEVKRFGSTYVTRTIGVEQSLNKRTAAALVFDPDTGVFRYVPALFSTVDGKTVATVKSTTNSIYVLADSAKTFADIASHWAKSDIERLASKLIVNGKSENGFAPEDSVTRAEFAALLVRSLGLTSGSGKQAGFADVASSDWYFDAVQTAAQYQLIEGFEDRTFRPQETITREQMAVMTARAMKLAAAQSSQASGASLASYQDASAVSPWAKKDLEQAIRIGIIQGQSADTLAPQSAATRAESVVILLRALQAMSLIDPS